MNSSYMKDRTGELWCIFGDEYLVIMSPFVRWRRQNDYSHADDYRAEVAAFDKNMKFIGNHFDYEAPGDSWDDWSTRRRIV